MWIARLALVALLTVNTGYATRPNLLFTAKSATEGELKFQGRVLMEGTKPTEAQALRQIEKQVLHLFGTMERSRYRASPLGNHTISNISVNEISAQSFQIDYQYTGRAIVAQGPQTQYTVIVPVNPDRVYAAGSVISQGKKSYPCTDSHYFQESSFWYYWSPYRRGCPLREGRDFVRWNASLRRFPNMTKSYPEYSRLVADGQIRLDTFFGMNDTKLDWNPLSSSDINASNYRLLRQELQRLGFAGRQWTEAEIRAVAGNTTAKLPFIEEFSKSADHAKLVVRLFFGATGLYEGSQPFHYFLKNALETASGMIYDGHSGYGANLNLGHIERAQKFTIAFPKDRYQILFFNSCSSYPYYRSQYFARKVKESDPNGTKDLDILTTGLATLFSVMGANSVAVVRAVNQWATRKGSLTYQQWASQIDSNNLFGVNGDEDNPTSPDHD